MLRIIQSNSAARAKSYYSTADYYSEGQELTGRWRGQGAQMLGLKGDIDREDWDLLCDNRRPDTEGPLTVRRKSERRVGYDFNFHCPKSVSLLYGLTQDERILGVFRESVDATMHAIEAEAKARVRRGGSNEDRQTGNLIWGEFMHLTARPENGVPDPHLHAHCLVFNATFDASEDRWKAAQFGDAKRDAPYFEAVFHARLARGFEELGLSTHRTATGWELDGFTPETLMKFSRRTAKIEKLAEERGITDPKAKAELGAKTRSGKVKDMTMPELQALWHSRMTAGEVQAMDAVAREIGERRAVEDLQAAHEAATRAMNHSFERAAVVPERTVLAEALRQGVGKASREAVEQAVQRQPLIHANRNGRRFVTTQKVLEDESRMLALARSGRGASRPIRPGPWRFQREWLNKEQKAAVRHVLESRDRIVIIRGAAGTGKTTMMQEAKEAIEDTGQKVFAFAPSAAASRGVLRQEGFTSADTVARLLADQTLQAELENAVLWIDEAGLVGTRTMCDIFELADRVHARVVLSGDQYQHSPVEHGSPLRLLEEEAGLQPVEVKEILRQKDQYKAIVKDLSEGRTEAGFHRMDKLGWIREVPDEDRYRVLASAYIDAIQSKKTALVIAPTHAEGHKVTAEIRRQLRERKLLGEESREYAQLIPANLTLGQRQDPVSYHPGDTIIFHQNAKGYRKGQRLIAGTDVIPFDQAERFTVFRQDRIELSAGDRIRITKNGKTKIGEHRVNNGDVFTVQGFAPGGDIILDNGWTLQSDYGHISHGVVTTSHSAQGKTVDCVFLAQSSRSFAASSQAQFYVSVSRGRHQVRVFTDDRKELLEAVGRTDERMSGTELLAGNNLGRPLPSRERSSGRQTHSITTMHERELVEHER